MHSGMLSKRACLAVVGLAIASSACSKEAEPTANQSADSGVGAKPAPLPGSGADPKSADPKGVVPYQKRDKAKRAAIGDFIASTQGKDFSGGVTELKIEEVSAGQGAAVETGDTISVRTTSSLFTTSRPVASTPIGAPLRFTVGDGTTIVGLDEGVVGMKLGGKRKLTIPPDKAYGDAGQRITVPANATLVYEVELVNIEK